MENAAPFQSNSGEKKIVRLPILASAWCAQIPKLGKR
jgi:hypothetical protein